jgi:hypothetical protein
LRSWLGVACHEQHREALISPAAICRFGVAVVASIGATHGVPERKSNGVSVYDRGAWHSYTAQEPMKNPALTAPAAAPATAGCMRRLYEG